MRTKFLTTCTACNGTGTYEEPFCTFGNETHYREIECGCENGKQLDYGLINEAIKTTTEAIKELKLSVVTYSVLMREYYKNKSNVLILSSVGLLIDCEEQLEQKEEYLDELESIEG
jgi:hypothetical protein